VAAVDVGLRQGVSPSARERGADQPRIRNTATATVEIIATCTGMRMGTVVLAMGDTTRGPHYPRRENVAVPAIVIPYPSILVQHSASSVEIAPAGCLSNSALSRRYYPPALLSQKRSLDMAVLSTSTFPSLVAVTSKRTVSPTLANDVSRSLGV